MANSATNIDGVIQSQSSKEVTINAFFDAASLATVYSRRLSTTTGLVWGFYGGNVTRSDGLLYQVSNGTITLTASTTNYIVALKSTGAVSSSTSTTNWNDLTNYWRLYSAVTGSTTITSFTDYREFGRITGGELLYVPALTVNTQTSSYTLVLADSFKYVRMDVGSSNNLTIPPNSSVAFITGTQIHVRQAGVGQTTIVAGSGVTINTPETLKIRKQHSTISLVKIATDTWEIMGDLEPA